MSRERENARFITPSPNVENFLAREKVLQIETQKERVYASFLCRDLQNIFRGLENILLRGRGYKMLRFLSRVTYSILSSS